MDMYMSILTHNLDTCIIKLFRQDSDEERERERERERKRNIMHFISWTKKYKNLMKECEGESQKI